MALWFCCRVVTVERRCDSFMQGDKRGGGILDVPVVTMSIYTFPSFDRNRRVGFGPGCTLSFPAWFWRRWSASWTSVSRSTGFPRSRRWDVRCYCPLNVPWAEARVLNITDVSTMDRHRYTCIVIDILHRYTCMLVYTASRSFVSFGGRFQRY